VGASGNVGAIFSRGWAKAAVTPFARVLLLPYQIVLVLGGLILALIPAVPDILR